MNVKAIFLITVPVRSGPAPGLSLLCRGNGLALTVESLTEQRVYIFFGYLGERRIERDPHVALAVYLGVNRFENHIHFGRRTLHAQAHEAEARPVVEDDDEDDSRGDYRDVNVVALAFM